MTVKRREFSARANEFHSSLFMRNIIVRVLAVVEQSYYLVSRCFLYYLVRGFVYFSEVLRHPDDCLWVLLPVSAVVESEFSTIVIEDKASAFGRTHI
ncbi:hypothetical protein K933_06543 [Candidatus Halobonum tyrrellensis G22]|uniref:Uncharacterized protein n=1 Tax=Candidatus Halobonum tyrrellensis G22 TaxID=1324957 RepID=V4GUW2_9EURY|nr:hypothetical protein K933_06543 [Candidatus Halobonum tyrrellensis G22]